MADKVNVKIETLQKVIDLIEDYEFVDALHILYSVCRADYRERIRKEKEQLYFKMRHSKSDVEYEKNKAEYDEFMRNSLL
jgi:gluconate kinase